MRGDMTKMKPWLHRIRLGFTWCFVLEAAEGYLLIDTSYPDYLPKLQTSLSKFGIDLSEIKYLLLTHHHDDHAGFAAELTESTGCQVIAHLNAVAPLSRGVSDDTIRPFNRRVEFVLSLFSLFHRHFSYPPLQLDANHMLIVGDSSDLPEQLGIHGKILYTPGHSRDSISLVLSDGSAFVGDVAMSFLRCTGIGHHPIYVEDIDQVHESWQMLIDQGARVIYPSHGDPFPAEELALNAAQHFAGSDPSASRL
jgi:glyoxylase-like metal-dependent hydrolase (beta-lactamase superfamily II)